MPDFGHLVFVQLHAKDYLLLCLFFLSLFLRLCVFILARLRFFPLGILIIFMINT